MKVYLAGPISGIEEGNRPAFNAAALALRQTGTEVVSPVEMDEAEGYHGTEPAGSAKWRELLARDLAIVIDPATDAIVVLPGWERSQGAALEVNVAHGLGKRVLVYPTLDPLTPERHPSSARFHMILRDLGLLHDRKQADYGRGDDPFANVRGSEEWGVAGWQGAMLRATDKVRRLQTFARTGTLVNEGVRDAFMDLAVYAIIAMVLFEDDEARADKA